ncbi:hypothetical protein HAX54_038811, partial [Datura stramonium]|nr:hypothetical protein [Datura stramonium]
PHGTPNEAQSWGIGLQATFPDLHYTDAPWVQTREMPMWRRINYDLPNFLLTFLWLTDDLRVSTIAFT